jgi:poly-beta-1,6-N-acetyl-D-glucosamine synthase
LHSPDRAGKTAALNRAVAEAAYDIIVMSDANTLLNPDAVARSAAHYAQDNVGGVAGEKKVVLQTGQDMELGSGEGAYWKYESFLKKTDSAFWSVVGAAGELFSFRKSLFEPVDPTVILDDFVISLKIAGKGYRVIYEPDAYAMEAPSFSVKEEAKRKVRIAAGGFQAMGMLTSLWRWHRHPRLTFLYLSHRVLRWAASPFCLIIALISGTVLGVVEPGWFFRDLWFAQLAFYAFAGLALILPLKGPLKLLKLPYYFVFMNVSVLAGLRRHLRGRQPAAWERSKRSGFAEHL